MKRETIKLLGFLCYCCFGVLNLVNGQNEPIILEAEDAKLGTDFSIEEANDVKYVTVTTNSTSDEPESEDRVITFEFSFPTAHTYDLYIRCRVGAAAANDDSFFYGSAFGVRSVSADEDWIRVNNIHAVGYTGDNELVDGEGIAGTSIWKWINLSEFTGDEPPITFEVAEDGLVQTFQLGAREDGLFIDKIAFARADYFYTVSNLDNGEAGSESNTGGGATTLPIAAGKTKFLGNVYSPSQAVSFANYWNQVTPENGGKWGSVEQSRDNMNWTDLDAAYALAKDNGFSFKLHVLIWGNQQPSWMENLSAVEQLDEIKEWFQAIAERYPAIDYIEVVNEPLHDPPNSAGNGGGNYINALGGNGATGWDWVLESFRLARQYFPNAKLMINDYNIVNSSTNTTRYLEIISLLQAENLIDQIGVQAHAFSTGGNISQMKSNLDALAATALPLYVTELDIDGATDAIQLSEYQRVFPLFWEHPSVEGITLWGFRPGMWRTEQGAYLIEQDGVTERPALVWLRGYVENSLTAIDELGNSDKMVLFPNPITAGDELHIKGIDAIDGLEIFDLTGKKIKSFPAENTALGFDLSIPTGLYIIQVYSHNTMYVRKLMVNGR